MRKKIWGAFLGIVFLYALFFAREGYLEQQNNTEIFFEEESMVVFHSEGIFVWGSNREAQDRIIANIKPVFGDTEVLHFNDMELGEALKMNNIIVHKISNHGGLISINDERFLLVENIWKEKDKRLWSEYQENFTPEWWVITSSRLSHGWNLPSEGILLLDDYNPRRDLETLAREHELPLLSIRQTGGWRMFYQSDVWKVYTRE